MDEVKKEVLVSNELGLHARPAAQLAQEAAKFEAQIKLILGESEVDAKSVLDILTLAAGRGTSLIIKAQGEDAQQAVDSLEHFFQQGLGEK